MLKAVVVVTGLLIVVTRTTPFDLVGVHVSTSPLLELTISVLVLLPMLVADK